MKFDSERKNMLQWYERFLSEQGNGGTETGDYEIWEFDWEDFGDSENGSMFFEKSVLIKSVPAYQFVLRYLLLHYDLVIGEKNMAGLWKYLQTDDWKVRVTISDKHESSFRSKLWKKDGELVWDMKEKDFKMLLSIVLYHLKQDFEKCGSNRKIVWTTYFHHMINDFQPKHLRNLALGLKMKLPLYQAFRKKVIRGSGMNVYDREELFTYLTLKYADKCGWTEYFHAYEALEKIYPEKKNGGFQKEFGGAKEICEWILTNLEEEGELKTEKKNTLFAEYDEKLGAVFEFVDAVYWSRKVKKESRYLKVRKTVENVFLEQWERLLSNIDKYVKGYETDKNWTYSGKQEIYRWLYGENVCYSCDNREISPSDAEMVWICAGLTDHYLDSQEFLETRIRDNTFFRFPLEEARQRNLILTLVFLNYTFRVYDVYAVDKAIGDYREIIREFEKEAERILGLCDFGEVSDENGYDALLKLMLSCDSPLELFRYIWRLKTGSLDIEEEEYEYDEDWYKREYGEKLNKELFGGL